MTSRQDIKKQMTDYFMGNPFIQSAYNLQPGKIFDEEFSLVSIENIIFETVAFAIALLAQMFDVHRAEIDKTISEQKSGGLPWYRYMILQYQHGFDLLPDSDQFDNAGATATQIAQAKVIRYAAVTESDDPGTLVLKIAGENSGELEPIDNSYLPAVKRYVDAYRYAGTRVNIINFLPDLLFLDLVIYRNPLVIDANGQSIRNGNKPIEDAINEFLKELPFNGELILAHLIDKLQLVEGVEIPHLVVAKSSWIDPSTNGYSTPSVINVKKVPESGYYKIPDFNNITYVVSN